MAAGWWAGGRDSILRNASKDATWRGRPASAAHSGRVGAATMALQARGRCGPGLPLGSRGRQPAVIEMTAQAREGWVRLVVEDSGPGVPRDIRHRIFDPFFTTKGPDEGTGLGLAICQRVVNEVGGKIWLEESPLGGAKFIVELPAAPEYVEGTTVG